MLELSGSAPPHSLETDDKITTERVVSKLAFPKLSLGDRLRLRNIPEPVTTPSPGSLKKCDSHDQIEAAHEFEEIMVSFQL
jgi:hypothetical protein